MAGKMKKIWEFFENMNNLVYVSDMDTYEVIYLNRRARREYGVSDMAEIQGKKCYEVMQNSLKPCHICNNTELCEGEFLEQKLYDPLLKRAMIVTNSMIVEDGHRYRFEMAVNEASEKQTAGIVRNYETLETQVNEAIRMALQAPSPDGSIDIILEYLGKALEGERTYVFERNEEGADDNTYEWVARGIKPEKENLQNVPPEVCAEWYRKFDQSRNIMIEDLEDIREEDPLQYKNLKRQGIHSLVVVPLYNEGRKPIGFYGVDNPPVKSIGYASNMLQIMGHFIASSIKRRNLLRQLKKMSFSDPLTGFGNRFAMNDFVEKLHSGESIGVVYCDITGLKRVNDSEGHEAGDKLIVHACECLAKSFYGCGLFRIGGDELLVLCREMDEATLLERVEMLKQLLAEVKVIMAVGAAWEKDGSVGIDELLKRAEEKMYEEKRKYYKTSGIERRRG